MKGKKSDPEFVSSFIKECLEKGHRSTKEIVSLAQLEIEVIDDKIKEIEKLKKHRSKLLDVIEMLDEKVKTQSLEVNILAFFDLKYPDICKKVCSLLFSVEDFDIKEIKKNSSISKIEDINFVIKQLVEYQIILKKNNFISRGPRFASYIQSVFHQAI